MKTDHTKIMTNSCEEVGNYIISNHFTDENKIETYGIHNKNRKVKATTKKIFLIYNRE